MLSIGGSSIYCISLVDKSDTDTVGPTGVAAALCDLDRKQQKLQHLLGHAVLVDVHNKHIQKQGISSLVKSVRPLSYFLLYLARSFQSELLFFYLDVEAFERKLHRHTEWDVLEAESEANRIFSLYLSTTSPLEINVDAKTRLSAEAGISSGNYAAAFQDAKAHVAQLLFHQYREAKCQKVFGLTDTCRNSLTPADFDQIFSDFAGYLPDSLEANAHPRDIIHAQLTLRFIQERVVASRNELAHESTVLAPAAQTAIADPYCEDEQIVFPH
ncbi:hypothetical protein HDV03_004595 [Kappamyces sp. JEL0829]|nr:hypothetical protein HDV03_004595 [Kappamyces sp. JEL0829]